MCFFVTVTNKTVNPKVSSLSNLNWNKTTGVIISSQGRELFFSFLFFSADDLTQLLQLWQLVGNVEHPFTHFRPEEQKTKKYILHLHVSLFLKLLLLFLLPDLLHKRDCLHFHMCMCMCNSKEVNKSSLTVRVWTCACVCATVRE